MTANTDKFLEKIEIRQLKNIQNLSLSFNKDRRVVAIFGENGCGKSTILYALACVYQQNSPQGTYQVGEQYRFADFFPPTNLGQWQGSELTIYYYENSQSKNRTYKKSNRWTRYEDRPRREIYFLGINLCVPQIETETKTSQIKIEQDKDSELKIKVLKDINYVLNRQYSKISFSNNKKYKLAEIDNISYPSLFMGAGERKVIEILRILHSSQTNALILIDELDLTLHTWALKKLLEVITDIANQKDLQIIFTSHREEIINFGLGVDIKYITNNLYPNKTECLSNINSDCLIELTGNTEIQHVIYVEDNVSKEIVTRFLLKNGTYEGCQIKIFGAATNAFTIACGLYLANKSLFDKSIFILDGDVFTTDNEKIEQIKKSLVGNEIHRNSDRMEILKKIIQYQSNGKNPERFIFDTICNSDQDTEIRKILNRTKAVRDDHDLISPELLQTSIEQFSTCPDWDDFTSELRYIFLGGGV